MTQTDIILAAADVGIAASTEGRLPRVNVLAYSGGLMNVGGFGPIVVDLRGMELPPDLPLLADHANNLDSVVGSGSATVRAGQLLIEGTLNITNIKAIQVAALAKAKTPLQASIGATPIESRRINPGETVHVNGRSVKSASAFTLVSKSRLREVSICPLGCDANTSVSIAAKLSKEKPMPATLPADPNDILASERSRVSEIEAARRRCRSRRRRWVPTTRASVTR